MALPRFVILQSIDNSYNVRYIPDEGEAQGFLKRDGSDITSSTIKMQVKTAQSGNGHVHLRSCYNNKYWALKSEGETWITASAVEPDEDQTKWSCTLFKPTFPGSDTTFYLLHVQTLRYVSISTSDAPFTNCLFAGSTSTSDQSYFRYVDWEALVFLPRYVAFKGFNGKYLINVDNAFPGIVSLEFTATDIGISRVGNEILMNNNGFTTINAISRDKLWFNYDIDSGRGVIVVSGDKNNPGEKSYFWPVKVGSNTNTIAFRSLHNGRYCSGDGYNNALVTTSTTITESAKIAVEELVLSKNIYDVNFRLSDARIYNQSINVMATGDAANRTKESNSYQVKLSYTNTKSSTWNCSLSLTLGMSITFETGVPFIADGKVDISTEFTSSYGWGETKESSTDLETVYTVTVPPMTKVKVNLLATKGTCDVPFSYTERDTLIDGQIATTTKDDGVYTGINCYNFYYDTKEEPLSV